MILRALFFPLIVLGGVAHAGSPPAAAALSPKAVEMLVGRTPREAVTCIPLRDIRSTTIVDGTAIIYKRDARRWYVSSPAGGACPALRANRTLVTRTPTNQLCRGDIVRVIDPPGPMEYGSCGLGEFVLYAK